MKIKWLLLFSIFLNHLLHCQEVQRRISSDVLAKAQSKSSSNQPLFIENKNQWDSEVKFLVRGKQELWFLNDRLRSHIYRKEKIESSENSKDLDSII